MRVLSGIQPTGQMHIGNYLGAARQWIELQHKHDCLFMIADLHALTVPQPSENFKKATFEKVMELMAVGLDPEKCILFIQSGVKEHTELAWILNTITPIAELKRMTQYKDKAKKDAQNINMGLLDYPVLMAADILLYKTEGVPVGKDQTQHLELTQMVARKFNAKYGKLFVEPKALLPKEGAKILSLAAPKKKMSKSDAPESYVTLFEEPELIRKKIMAAITDKGKEIRYNPAKKPGISNLLAIYSLFARQPINDIEKQFGGAGYADFKKALGELLVEKLDPFRRKKEELQNRELYIREILMQGAKKARSIAQETMEQVRSKIGLFT